MPISNSQTKYSNSTQARHLAAQIAFAPQIALPPKQRLPFGWSAQTIGENPLVLNWPDFTFERSATALRFAIALDARDEKRIEAFLPQTQRALGICEVRFASQFQIYEIALAPEDAAEIKSQGVALRLVAGTPLPIFSGGENLPSEFLPHLLLPGEADAMSEFFARLENLSCIQQFGWMEGCVLDGLLDLSHLPQHAHLRESARSHLKQFIPDDRLIYEGPSSVPADGTIYGIEGTLPFAALAKLQPRHPSLEIALQFWRDKTDESGAIPDGGHLSTEGALTAGYPLAVLARARNDEKLALLALSQLRVRQTQLFDGHTFWRTKDKSGAMGNRNWARGIAWQLLGTARVLGELKERADIADIIVQFRELALWARGFQLESGLWSVFADEPNLTPDTGGSAGIAAAFALGAREGWLESEFFQSAEKTLAGLQTWLSPDGFLGGVSQSNKGGEELQRGDYRVIYQMAMGLMAQLIAALETRKSICK